jgi:hypothetical protein
MHFFKFFTQYFISKIKIIINIEWLYNYLTKNKNAIKDQNDLFKSNRFNKKFRFLVPGAINYKINFLRLCIKFIQFQQRN